MTRGVLRATLFSNYRRPKIYRYRIAVFHNIHLTARPRSFLIVSHFFRRLSPATIEKISRAVISRNDLSRQSGVKDIRSRFPLASRWYHCAIAMIDRTRTRETVSIINIIILSERYRAPSLERALASDPKYRGAETPSSRALSIERV